MTHLEHRNSTPTSRTCSALESVLSQHPEDAAVRHVVDIARRMALAYLHRKAKTGRLRPECFGLSFADLALDTCAELFQRDDEGRFVELAAYFEALDRRQMNEADIPIALRRIVFSKVSEGLFRRYRENDPNLGKVIRNIKDVARTIPQARVERVGRELWLIAEIGEQSLVTERPVAPPEIVEAYVTSALGTNGATKEAIAAFVTFVTLHPYYRNGIPVSVFARLVRSAFIRLGAAAREEDYDEPRFSTEEVAQAINAATSLVRARMHHTYVSRKKVDGSTFGLYLRTVRDILESQYLHDAASTHSHFDVMATHLPALSEVEFRRRHRNRLEYMVKLARARVAEFLADKPIGSAAGT